MNSHPIGSIKKLLGLLLCVSVCMIQAQGQTTRLSWPGPPTGAYAVGFQHAFVIDSTRSFFRSDPLSSSNEMRPIRIYIWYPAEQASSTDPMRFENYIVHPAPEGLEAYHELLLRHDRHSAAGQFLPGADTLVNKLLHSETLAVLDAPAAEGSFPLIVHSTGINGWQAEGSILYEYLASHGYVVVNVPQVGPYIDQPNVPYSTTGVSLQGKDLAVAMDYVLNEPFVDKDRIAAMGHSFGGLVALWLASHNPAVDAVVSLDGSNVIPRGIEISDELDWSLDEIRIPIFSLYTLASGDRDLRLMREIRQADRYFVTYPNASHFDFQNWPLHVLRWNISDTRAANKRPHEDGASMYRASMLLARHFLDATLKGDNDAIQAVTGDVRLQALPEGTAFMYEKPAGARSGH